MARLAYGCRLQRAHACHTDALLHRSLSTQQYEQLTRQVVRNCATAFYAEALEALASRPFITPVVLTAFRGFSDALLAAALARNATSCAISNFPDERSPDAGYVHDIRRDLAHAWQNFALAANERLLPGSAAATPHD